MVSTPTLLYCFGNTAVCAVGLSNGKRSHGLSNRKTEKILLGINLTGARPGPTPAGATKSDNRGCGREGVGGSEAGPTVAVVLDEPHPPDRLQLQRPLGVGGRRSLPMGGEQFQSDRGGHVPPSGHSPSLETLNSEGGHLQPNLKLNKKRTIKNSLSLKKRHTVSTSENSIQYIENKGDEKVTGWFLRKFACPPPKNNRLNFLPSCPRLLPHIPTATTGSGGSWSRYRRGAKYRRRMWGCPKVIWT